MLLGQLPWDALQPFPTGAWAPSFGPRLQCSGCSGVPSPCPALSELIDTASALGARLPCCLLCRQRAACPTHRIISECEPALHLLCFTLARPQSVYLFPTCCFCSPGSCEYLTAGPERQHVSAGFSEQSRRDHCWCWLGIPALRGLVVLILLAFPRAGHGCSSFGCHVHAPCEG